MKEFKTEYLNLDPDWHLHLQALTQGVKASDSHNSKQDLTVKTNGNSPSGAAKGGTVGILNINGALLYSGAWWHEYMGFVSYDVISAAFDQLLADSDVKTIVLRIQSPGGTAFGAGELSQKIFDARSQKKIVAYADPYAFSAAYQIGSAAHEFYVTPSGMVGSIGSYSMHVDQSVLLEKAGIKVTFIKAGEKKTDGNEYQALSEQAKKDIQLEVDRFYDAFVSDVARNRGVTDEVVKANFGKGGRVMAQEAVDVGMVDGIKIFENLLAGEMQQIQSLYKNEVFIKNNLLRLQLED